ncbi:hypothetical protein SAMN05216327_12333 [Dyadobacter sp. SG02]|uniref:hypothetical protein n=1 Tax=Dyadobacter sp. SG02 TaxID=1855291 RepID=UPI0008D73564|nr:hypothetical protein [Dyadobacter sp. SG02]SEJ83813.1 hypothetical protein SAMN05216327_12333 [Dyadobacter sp. SG02]
MLYIYLTYLSLFAPFHRADLLSHSTSTVGVDQLRGNSEAGYFFALRQVPLDKKEYIFTADLLKRAIYFNAGKTIPLSYTMTVKKARGFDMYFSATDYSIILSVKEQKEVDELTIDYQGTLLVRHGRDRQKFAVHGLYVR